MQITTSGDMLNFGYWSSVYNNVVLAQNNLCKVFGDLAELYCAKHVLDVGSGFSAPSRFWQNAYQNLHLYNVNVSFNQMATSTKQKNIEFVNSTSTKLPFSDNSVDRVLSLESAQHFKPLSDFICESKRVLDKSGLLVLAVPVTVGGPISRFNILNFTWSSEHYTLEYLQDTLNSIGFSISEKKLIGSFVYEPLADYYTNNRTQFKKAILERYPAYVEQILYKSLKEMKKASQKKSIDYVLLKCHM